MSLYPRRYAEPLFDVLIAGGFLAPGGKIMSVPRAEVCVFACEPMVEAVRVHVQVSDNTTEFMYTVVRFNCKPLSYSYFYIFVV